MYLQLDFYLDLPLFSILTKCYSKLKLSLASKYLKNDKTIMNSKTTQLTKPPDYVLLQEPIAGLYYYKDFVYSARLGGHSIPTWTRRGGKGSVESPPW